MGYMCLTIPNHSFTAIQNGSLSTVATTNIQLLQYILSEKDFKISPESTSPHNPVQQPLREM